MLSKEQHEEALTKYLELMGIETIVIAYRYKDDLIGRLQGNKEELKKMTDYLSNHVKGI